MQAAPPAVLDFLQGIGVSLVSLSNNHAWDLGDEGIESTLMQLDSRGIPHARTAGTSQKRQLQHRHKWAIREWGWW